MYNFRLFGKSEPTILSENDFKLNKDVFKNLNNDLENNSSIEAGYTYIGQMIAHDIIPSTTQHESRFQKKDVVSPLLNLDSIYMDNKDFYENKEIFNELGQFNFVNVDDEVDKDLVRSECGKALIPDPRNDENIIIAQLHLIWQKVHNKIIEDNFKEINKTNAIKKTREFLSYIFQEIVIHDFLKKVLHPIIYEIYCIERKLVFYDFDNDLKVIPYEFSHAAFRFGHSMIRNQYSIKLDRRFKALKFKELFLKKGQKQICNKQIISWERFFEINNKERYSAEKAFIIDTRIVSGMLDIPNVKNHNIINNNLETNKNIGIKSGVQIYELLMKKNKIKGVLINFKDLYSDLNIEGSKYLLWPYVLKEAELMQNSSTSGLGIVGSVIVAEVIMKSIHDFRKKLMYPKIIQINEYIKENIPDERGTDRSNPRLQMKDIINFIK